MAADLGGVLSAATEYGDAREAEGRAAAEVEGKAALAALRAEYDAYVAAHPDMKPTPAPEPEPPTTGRKMILGMSSPAKDWDTRLGQVGADGITARRIFADLTADGRSQSDLIAAAVKAKMMPVVSYKGTPTAANLAAVKGYLASLGVPVVAVYHHEPHGDMTPAEFVTRSRAFLNAVQAPNVKVGPFLNGWLLDRRVADFASYTDADLLNRWDFVGIDTYEAGTIEAPADPKPAARIPLLVKWLASVGHAGKPIAVGEYNGYSGATIAAAGEAFLSEPTVEFACMWNSTIGKGHVLEGERLAAFRATKADPRVKR
jgi:hypothetical protein